ncbi:MAG TPA: nucleoside triphosphate pyrophosphohydrolase [bacterium]|nr:nucleoside triphosphate pyrophosphohydrolase [bacterium]
MQSFRGNQFAFPSAIWYRLFMVSKNTENNTNSNPPEELSVGQLFEELCQKMAQLRSPQGCPWDREQTHLTLKKYLIEEAYEACEAFEDGDPKEIAEELGDVLLQVVFHAEIGTQAGTFGVADVIRTLIDKLVQRHPHVFGDVPLETAQEVLQQWEENKLKQSDRKESILDGIPKNLPALLKAMRVQERVQRVGFDWNQVAEVLAKVREEISEFEEALQQDNREKMQEELGDAFFALVNLARFVHLDPELSLARTVEKFCRRFRYIEQEVARKGLTLRDVDLAEMDYHWEQAKTKV